MQYDSVFEEHYEKEKQWPEIAGDSAVTPLPTFETPSHYLSNFSRFGLDS